MQTIIETERLILRPFTMADVEPSYQMNLDPEVTRYTADGGVQTREHIEALIRDNVLGDYQKYGYGRFAVVHKADDVFIGFTGLKYLPDIDEVDLGYRFARKYWGQGIATESCIASLDFGFKTLQLERVIGLFLVDNKASARVMEKLGMHYEKSFLEAGEPALQYAITKEQWLARGAR